MQTGPKTLPVPNLSRDADSAPASGAESAPDVKSTAVAVAELGRLRWRCRRGMRELDVLLERYVDEHYRTASHGDQKAFKQLLDTQDTVIYAYCLGRESPPPPLAGIIEQITTNSPAGR